MDINFDDLTEDEFEAMALATKLRDLSNGLSNALSKDELQRAATMLSDGIRQRTLLINEVRDAAMKAGIIHDRAMQNSNPADVNGPLAMLLIQDLGTLAKGPDLKKVKHKKRGSTYDVLGEGEVQISKSNGQVIYEGVKLVVYRCHTDGKLWLRFPDEFNDGRFEDVP